MRQKEEGYAISVPDNEPQAAINRSNDRPTIKNQSVNMDEFLVSSWCYYCTCNDAHSSFFTYLLYWVFSKIEVKVHTHARWNGCLKPKTNDESRPATDCIHQADETDECFESAFLRNAPHQPTHIIIMLRQNSITRLALFSSFTYSTHTQRTALSPFDTHSSKLNSAEEWHYYHSFFRVAYLLV